MTRTTRIKPTRGALPATLLLALLGLQACSSIRYRHDFDERADFAAYETYGWPEEAPVRQEESAPPANDLILRRIRYALDETLRSKGLEFAELPEQPDLLVFIQTAVHDRVDVQSWGYGYARRDVQVYNYKEGSLVVELWDREREELVWHSSAEGVQEEGSPDALDRKVDEIVERMFREYPAG